MGFWSSLGILAIIVLFGILIHGFVVNKRKEWKLEKRIVHRKEVSQRRRAQSGSHEAQAPATENDDDEEFRHEYEEGSNVLRVRFR